MDFKKPTAMMSFDDKAEVMAEEMIKEDVNENGLTEKEIKDYKKDMRDHLLDTYICFEDLHNDSCFENIPEDKLEEIINQFCEAVAEEAVKNPDMDFVNTVMRHMGEESEIDDEYTGLA